MERNATPAPWLDGRGYCGSGSRVAVALVPAAHMMPLALLYSDRSTMIGCVDSIRVPNDSFTSSGASLCGPVTPKVMRLAAGTSIVFATVVPSVRRNVSVAMPAVAPGFDNRM